MDAIDKELAEARAHSANIGETAEQRTQRWLMERLGHCTASRFKDVMDFTKAAKEGAKRKQYRLDIIGERLTGSPAAHWVSQPMQDGIDREPLAKLAYEARTGRMLEDCGFTHHPTIKWCGGSPDSIIGDDGGAEFKCPGRNTHILTLQNGMDAEHQYQIQGLMLIFKRGYWDFGSYHPEFPAPLDLYIQRIERDEKFLSALEQGIRDFLGEIEEQLSDLRARMDPKDGETHAVNASPASGMGADPAGQI